MLATTLSDATEGLAELRRAATGAPYRFVIADCALPGMSGVELSAAIRSDPAVSGTVVIVLTTLGSWRQIRGLEPAGIDACLVKPIRQAQLREAIFSAWQHSSLSSLSSRLDPAPQRILVADDNTANQRVLVQMLEGMGIRADVAATGREAIEMLRLLRYDLVLMDAQMPEMDGVSATAEIRRKEAPAQRTPILAMVGELSPDVRDHLVESGTDDVLLKPIRRHTLESTIRKYLPPPAAT
jgi:CheY-like chemotaxis protein